MQKRIYEKGIKFKCQGSANCCVSRGSYGFVFLSKKDIKKLSNFFSLSIEKFISIYCDKTDGYLHLKEIKQNGDCQYLENKKCNVYKARPTQCRTWPFWPDNMNSKTWNNEVVNFCPGIGKGKILTKYKIEEFLEKDLRNSKEIYKENN